MEEVTNLLFELRDEGYRDFHSKLMPTVARERVIGVRVPRVRKLAKELTKSGRGEDFLNQLPHRYYEEYNLHACLIEGMKDYERAIVEVERLLPYVDNWATCDMLSPRCFKLHLVELEDRIKRWLGSRRTYTIRFGIDMLMRYYLEEETFNRDYLEWVIGVDSEEYYISMGVAWYIATALAKQREATMPILRGHRLLWHTHNRAIQKAVESYRIDKDLKAELRELRVRREGDYERNIN